MNISISIVLISTSIFLYGCTRATESMLPAEVSEVEFSAPEGKTGWSKYEHIETFHGYDVDQIYEAAKVGLGSAGFSLIRADKSKGIVIGEHGITLHDWNIMSGVYFKKVETATMVKVIVEGSKDTGFSGDVTSDGWSGKILMGMRQYLNATYQSILKVNKSDVQ